MRKAKLLVSSLAGVERLCRDGCHRSLHGPRNSAGLVDRRPLLREKPDAASRHPKCGERTNVRITGWFKPLSSRNFPARVLANLSDEKLDKHSLGCLH
jgi:hypothetical protein